MAKILIVDDDVDYVECVKVVLERAGHSVTSANNRDDGMEMVQAKKPDLLVLDIMMEEPDDGIAMAQDLRKTGFKNPILMMSGIARATGLAYDKDNEVTPVDDFVEKPVKPAVLLDKINALLKR